MSAQSLRPAHPLHPAVFLDRDDTLIANPGHLGDPEGVALLPGAAAACRRLNAAGYRVVVVTNQSGVARGLYEERSVHAVHARIADLLRADSGATVDGWYWCPFHPEAVVDRYRMEHPWRKPGPGMLLAAARDLALDLQRSWMVGDQERDVDAGAAVGCRTIRLTGDASLVAVVRRHSGADFVEAALPQAVERILAADAAISEDAAGSPAPRAQGSNAIRPARVTLRAQVGQPLLDPEVRAIVEAEARAIAERTGVELTGLRVDGASLTAELAGPPIVGVGFAAELRRHTDAWYRRHHGMGLWGPQ